MVRLSHMSGGSQGKKASGFLIQTWHFPNSHSKIAVNCIIFPVRMARMASVSSSVLIDALHQYRLLEPMQLDEVKNLQARFPDPKALARELIQRSWLTAYQVNQLLQNKGHELVLGSYILQERLGEGGMGQVFKARHRNLGRIVAVKLIRKERLENPAAIKRFEREVRAAAALSHPNIVHAFDADDIGGTHLLVMECVEGAVD